MVVQQLSDDKIAEAINLSWDCFLEFIAPDYNNEGVESFKKFINDKKQINSLNFLAAIENNELQGILAANFNTNNICLFFVKNIYHKRGIGKALFNYFLLNTNASRITVNSSPYAVGFYHKLGFKNIADEQICDGIRFTPMEYLR